MSEDNLVIEQLENEIEPYSDTESGPMLKEKRARGRPKGSNGPPKPPKENGRKIRSEKQKEAWDKMQKLNAIRRAEKKVYKEEEMARIYMESKQKESSAPTPAPAPITPTPIPTYAPDSDTDSDSSIELSTRQITQLMKAKLKKKQNKAISKKKKKPVYESSESDTDSFDSDNGSSSSDSDNVIPRMKSRNKVYVERPKVAKVQQSFNSASYFV